MHFSYIHKNMRMNIYIYIFLYTNIWYRFRYRQIIKYLEVAVLKPKNYRGTNDNRRVMLSFCGQVALAEASINLP